VSEHNKHGMKSQAESTPDSEAKQRLTFVSNESSSTGLGSSLGGPSTGVSSASRFSEIGEVPSAGLPDSSNVDIFEDRMKRWGERRDQKKRQRAQTKKLTFQATTKVVTTDGQDATAPALKGQNGGVADVQDLLIQKGLPIVSLELIGSGNFAKVYKGVQTQDGPGNTKTQSVVAVKVIKKMQSHSKLGQDASLIPPKWLEREVKTNHAQNHDNLVRVIETSLDSLPYAIVLEYCSGSLHDSIIGDPSTTLHRFTWEHRLKAALDIALGMAHLHEQNIIHRDLKTQNVLLLHPVLSPGDTVLAKVCDFGLARYLPNDEFQTQLTHQVGSWFYMAPEMLDGDSMKAYDGKTDVYSYAVVLYEMLAGDLHYESGKKESFGEFVMFTFAGGRPREDAIPEGAPEALISLMKEGWRAEPSERPEFPAIADRLRGETCAKPSQGSSICSLSGLASCFGCLGR